MDDGGFAFPYNPNDYDSGAEGMSLRDYFAAAAVQGMTKDFLKSWCSPGAKHWLCNEARSSENEQDYIVAHAAYRIADAMLAERKETTNDE